MLFASHCRDHSKRWCLLFSYAPWALLIALSVHSLSLAPAFNKDGQYYVQSAILWSEGKTTFAASWIGGRDLVVLYYNAFFQIFGRSIDALTLSVSFAKTAASSGCIIFLRKMITSNLAFSVAACLASILVFSSPVMQSPASDNVGVMLLALSLALIAFTKSSEGSVPLILLAAVLALLCKVRSEATLWVIALAASAVIDRSSPKLSLAAIGSATFLALFFSVGLLWGAWVPTPKPHSYGSALAFFDAIRKHGNTDNGPASQRLGALLDLPEDSAIPYWDAVGRTYELIGPKDSNALITQAGIEALRTHWRTALSSTLESFSKIISQSGSMELKNAESIDGVQQHLQILDRDRARASDSFGGDAIYPTATLVDTRIGPIETLAQTLPQLRPLIQLPASFLLISLAMSCLLAGFRRSVFWLSLPVFGIGVAAVSALTQGSGDRYISPALVISFSWCAASLAALIGKGAPIRSGQSPDSR